MTKGKNDKSLNRIEGLEIQINELREMGETLRDILEVLSDNTIVEKNIEDVIERDSRDLEVARRAQELAATKIKSPDAKIDKSVFDSAVNNSFIQKVVDAYKSIINYVESFFKTEKEHEIAKNELKDSLGIVNQEVQKNPTLVKSFQESRNEQLGKLSSSTEKLAKESMGFVENVRLLAEQQKEKYDKSVLGRLEKFIKKRSPAAKKEHLKNHRHVEALEKSRSSLNQNKGHQR